MNWNYYFKSFYCAYFFSGVIVHYFIYRKFQLELKWVFLIFNMSLLIMQQLSRLKNAFSIVSRIGYEVIERVLGNSVFEAKQKWLIIFFLMKLEQQFSEFPYSRGPYKVWFAIKNFNAYSQMRCLEQINLCYWRTSATNQRTEWIITSLWVR